MLVVDDHDMVRRGVEAMLEAEDDIEVCGMVATADETLAAARASAPDVVLLDVRLGPGGTGIDVARALRRELPESRVLLFTGVARDADVVAALMAGASGFIQKGVDQEALVDAIRTVAGGGTLFDEELTANVLHRLADDEDTDPRLATLSEREREILRLMADGHTNREIAHKLHLAEKTVKNHITRLLAKLGVQRRTEAIRIMAGQL